MSWTCEKCGELNDDIHVVCWKCKLESGGGSGSVGDLDVLMREVVCSTTPEIPGRAILESKGVVCGEAIMGANVLRDLVASVTDLIGGRSGVYESKLRDGRRCAMASMVQEAKSLGADAIVGVDIDYETVGQTMLMICASGTAVVLKE